MLRRLADVLSETLMGFLALAALGTLGPTALTSLLRSLVRNLPLTIGIAVLSYLLIEESIERDRSFGAKPEPAE